MPTPGHGGDSESGGSPAGNLTGNRLGRFEVQELIGSGGMGEVYKAWDPLLKRWVALKRVHPGLFDGEHRRLLLREARSASTLNHRAIVAVHDALELEDEVCIVEEFATGTRLRDRLGSPFDLQDFFTFSKECACALVAAAENETVHCDLKPENILMTEEGLPRILDFGIARCGTRNNSTTLTPDETEALGEAKPRGTPAYMAPEVLSRQAVDSRTDIFSLGVVFYEMLTTVNPFQKRTLSETLASVMHDTPARPSKANPRIPRDLDALILRMLEKDRNRRQETPQQLLQELQQAEARHVKRNAGWRKLSRSAPARFATVLVLGGLIAIGIRSITTTGSRDASATPHVIVTPFENLSPDSELEFLADGLMEAVQTRLSRLRGIYLVRADSEVGGSVALEGSLQEAVDRLRVTYRIVDRGTGITLTGDFIEGPRQEIFRLQDRVTEGIAAALIERFDLQPLPASGPHPTADEPAYDLYLRGRGYLLHDEDPSNVGLAVDLFKNSLERDPEFALAHAGLADAYWRRFEMTRDQNWARMAEDASVDALARGPGFAEIHVTLGTIYQGTGKFERAAQEFQKALEINPRNDEAYVGLALAQESAGDVVSAEQTFHRAIEERPDYWVSQSELATFHYRHGRYEQARHWFGEVLEMTPKNVSAHTYLGATLLLLGRTDDAIQSFRRSIAIEPTYKAYANLAFAYWSEGRFPEAAEMYEKALDLDDRDHRVWAYLGAVYKCLPKREAAADSAFRRAIALAEPLLTVNPNDAELLAQVATCYAALDEPYRSKRLVTRALELAPDLTSVLVLCADALETLGDRTRALELIQKALASGYPIEALRHHAGFSELLKDPRLRETLNRATHSASDG